MTIYGFAAKRPEGAAAPAVGGAGFLVARVSGTGGGGTLLLDFAASEPRRDLPTRRGSFLVASINEAVTNIR